MTSAEKLIFTLRHRVVLDGVIPPGDGAAAVRQLDAVLLQAGFTCSTGLLAALSRLEPGRVLDMAIKVTG